MKWCDYSILGERIAKDFVIKRKHKEGVRRAYAAGGFLLDH